MSTGESPTENVWLGGADGTPNGWIVVLASRNTGDVRCRTVPRTEDLFALPEGPAVLGVDMVIGCPDVAAPGGRCCDREARSLLGHPRSSSVFSPPAYGALSADTYDEAQRRNRESGPDAPGLSKQTFYLFPKIRSLAGSMTPDRQSQVVEVHPELAFYVMNGDRPVKRSKHTPSGLEERIDLLEGHGFPNLSARMGDLAGTAGRPHDLVDAHAACWTARRVQEGTAERCPPLDVSARRNDRGLRMEIWR